MKKKITIGIFLTLGFFASNGQKVTNKTLKHSYFRTPKFILSIDKKINKEIILSYKEENNLIYEENKELNQQRKEDADADKKSYDEKKTSSKVAERILLGKKKPSGVAHVNTPYTQKEWSSDYILNNGCKTIGLEISETSKAKILITVLPISISYTEHNVEATTNKDGSVRPAYYTYDLSGKAGVRIDAFNESGKLVISESFTKLNSTRSKKFNSQYVRNNDYVKNEKIRKLTFEKKLMEEDLKNLQEYIHNNFEYQLVEKKSTIFTIKDKKGIYTQINECYPIYTKGLQYLSTEETYEKGVEIIKEVIPVYEEQLKNYNPNDKKAIINNDIAQALYLNLAQAYIWTNNFEKANNCLIEYKIINPKKSKNYLQEQKIFLDDQEIRFRAKG